MSQQQHSQSQQYSQESAQELQHRFLLSKYQHIFQMHPKLTSQQAFYYEYCKLYIDTLQTKKKVNFQNIKIEQQIQQIDHLRARTQNQSFKPRRTISQISNQDTSEQKMKRLRRTANEIARHYVCRVEKCEKSYGSEGSLNQHMKIKHPQLMDVNF